MQSQERPPQPDIVVGGRRGGRPSEMEMETRTGRYSPGETEEEKPQRGGRARGHTEEGPDAPGDRDAGSRRAGRGSQRQSQGNAERGGIPKDNQGQRAKKKHPEWVREERGAGKERWATIQGERPLATEGEKYKSDGHRETLNLAGRGETGNTA
ncbi:hypothetical protein NN561_019367 [Cricetulus griseus]